MQQEVATKTLLKASLHFMTLFDVLIFVVVNEEILKPPNFTGSKKCVKIKKKN